VWKAIKVLNYQTPTNFTYFTAANFDLI